MKIKLSFIALGFAFIISCGQSQSRHDSQVTDIYRDVAEDIFSHLKPVSLNGTQINPNKNVQSRTEQCSLKIIQTSKDKKPQFQFTFVRPGKSTAETTKIEGEKMSGTLGGTLMNDHFLPPTFQVAFNKDKTTPTGYVVSFLFNEIECQLQEPSNSSPVR